MPNRNSHALLKLAIGAVLVSALAVAGYAVLNLESLTGSPQSFKLDLSGQLAIDPGLIRFHQAGELPLELAETYAIAVGPEDRIFVAGDRVVQAFQRGGQQELSLATAGVPRCLAVGGPDHVFPGRVYVGADGKIELFNPQGGPLEVWENLGDGAVLTSIALADEDLFVADAGNRVVLRLKPDGTVAGRIGDRKAGGQSPGGFIIPSPYFDVTTDPHGLVHIVNPGVRRVETYTMDGVLQLVWGQASSDIRGFFGCCNPSHLARLPDGRWVTSEKGIPRVKLYRAGGEFDCVVAGPQQLAIRYAAVGDPRAPQHECVYDVATDSQGRILVLDPVTRSVRIFVSNEPPAGSAT